MGFIKKDKEKKEQKVEEKPTTVSPKVNEEIEGGSVASNRLLIKPLITEKAAVAQALNKYSFVVSLSANKETVKKAIKEIYGVEPKSVNMINVEGKTVRRGRQTGKRGDYKKAVITLPKGKSISIHEGV